MTHDDLPLFKWLPVGRVIIFPMPRRSGRIRDVALKMLDKPTDRAALSYRNQVTDALLKQLGKTGLGEEEQDEHIGKFWSAVQVEINRLVYRAHRPDGGHVA
ncbi:DUF6074 family protein [Mesorhizobium sp. M0983]|uniref:DUF6074 family protein n=1 Tax=Mesorhizobium sp. M0983 TaxID=2957040 RepID=UPI0033352019